MKPEASIPPDWKWGTPEGSRELDRLLDRRLTFREILEWQEASETLLLRLQAGRTPAPASGPTGQATLHDAPQPPTADKKSKHP
jgi:hypothetical protein